MVNTMQGKVHTLPELAEALGINYSTAWARVNQSRSIPAPDVKVGRRSFYSATEFDRIVQLLKEDVR